MISTTIKHARRWFVSQSLRKFPNVEQRHTSVEATQLIKSHANQSNAVEMAAKIYSQTLDSDRNGYVINAFLKILKDSSSRHWMILQISDDIIGFHRKRKERQRNQEQNLGQAVNGFLLLHCCEKSYKSDYKQTLKLIENFVCDIDEKDDIILLTKFITFLSKMNRMNKDTIKSKTGKNSNDALKVAVKLFDSMIKIGKKDVFVIGAMMKCLNENGKYKKSMKIFETIAISDDELKLVNAVTLNLYLGACIGSGSYTNGARIIEKLSLSSEDCDAKYKTVELSNQLISFYNGIGDIGNALSVFYSIPNDEKSIVTVGSMMKCLNENKRFSDSMRIFEAIADTDKDKGGGISNNGLVNDVILNSYLRACIGNKSFENGIKIIKKYSLTTSNINEKFKTIELFNQLIHFYGAANDLKMALTIFNNIPNDAKSAATIASMMKCLNENNKFAESIKVFEKLGTGLADGVVLNMYLNACISCNAYENGARIIEQFSLGKPEQINPKYNTIQLLSQLIRFYASRGKIGDVDNAMRIFNSIDKNKHDIITVGSIMKCLNENNRFLDSVNIFETISNAVNAVTLNLYLSACIGSKSFSKGENIIDKYSLGMSDSKSKFKTIELLNQVIHFYNVIDDVDAAWYVFYSIPNNKKEKDKITIGTMMNCLNTNRIFNDSMKIFNTLAKCNDLVDDVTLNLFLEACIGNQSFDAGASILEEYSLSAADISMGMNDDSHKSKHKTVELFSQIIHFYGARGSTHDAQNATKVFESITDDKKDVTIIRAMINALIELKQMDDALDIFYQIKNGKYGDKLKFECLHSARLYCILLNGCAKNVCFVNGISIINEMKEYLTSEEYSTLMMDEYLQDSLIQFYSKCDQIQTAVRLFDEWDSKGNVSTIAIESMMIAYANCGDDDKSYQLFKRLKTGKLSVRVFAALFVVFGKAGRVKEAQDIFDERIVNNSQYVHLVTNHVILSSIMSWGRKSKKDLIEIANNYGDKYIDLIDPVHLQIGPLIALLSCCLQHNEYQIGKETFAKAKKLVGNNITRVELDTVYTLFAVLLENCGKVQECVEVRQEKKVLDEVN